MTYKAKVAVCSELRPKHSTQSEHHVQFLKVKTWLNIKKQLVFKRLKNWVPLARKQFHEVEAHEVGKVVSPKHRPQLESSWLCNYFGPPTELSPCVRDSGLGDSKDHWYSNRWLQSAGWPDPVWNMRDKCSDHPARENVGPGPTATKTWAQTKLIVSRTVHFLNDRAGTPDVDVAIQMETLEDHGATWRSRKTIIRKKRKVVTKNMTKELRNLTVSKRQCTKKQMRRELRRNTVMYLSAVRKVNW